MPIRFVFAEGKSLQKLVLLLPKPEEFVVTVTFRRYEMCAGEVTLTWKVYVEFTFPLLMLTVMFVSSPSCMRFGETDNEYAGAAEVR